MVNFKEFLGFIGVSACVLLAGYLLCFPFFSFLPLYWSIGLVLTFLVGGAIRQKKYTSIFFLTAGMIYTVIFFAVFALFTGNESCEEYQCNWSIGDAGIGIDLSPVNGFSWTRVVSDDLRKHLEKDHPPSVRVAVSTIRDFGRIRARGSIETVDNIRVHELPY